ncbi:MAG: hypothetical protein ACPG47_05555 [Leucothrix sp.]
MLKIVGKKSALVWLVAALLVGCGAGETTKSQSSAVPQSSVELPKSSQLSASQQAQLAQSINSIKRNPITQGFAITTSYPYVITGNITQAAVEHWKGRIQRTQGAVKSMYFKHDPAQVVQIWLFKDAASYFQYNKSLWNASPGTGFGYYLPKQKRMMMNIASGGGTLTHELVHPYIEANFPRSPLWFNEGLASLYEQSYYQGGKVFGATNWRLRGLQAVIRADAMPSLTQMMKTNRSQFLGPNREIYYAQARYLMFYLQSRGLLEKYYHQFVAASPTDPNGIKTLLSITGFQSVAQLESTWVAFIRKLRF